MASEVGEKTAGGDGMLKAKRRKPIKEERSVVSNAACGLSEMRLLVTLTRMVLVVVE